MLVRPMAVMSDLPGLRAMWRATWLDTYGPVLGRERLHLLDEALAEPNVHTMFAADGGGFVGIVEGEIVGSVCFAERHGIGYAWGMYIHPAHQHRGIGAALLRQAASTMVKARRLQLSTITPESEAFYRHLGFRIEGTSEFELFPGVVRPSTWLGIDAQMLRDGLLPSDLTPPA